MHLEEGWQAEESVLYQPKTQWEALKWLQKAGFKVNPHSETISNLDEMKIFLKQPQFSNHLVSTTNFSLHS